MIESILIYDKLKITDKYIIYIKNFIAFVLLSLLRFIFKNTNNEQNTNSILFINSGQIGDLMVSSLLLDNDHIFEKHNKVVFMIKNEYLELFGDYEGKIIILGYSYKQYKWNLFYRVKLLKLLRNYNFSACYNLTAARGILNDEQSILSGANNVYCLSNNWKYLTKAFGKITDTYYKEILFKGVINEYEKHYLLLEKFKVNTNVDFSNIKLFKNKVSLLTFFDNGTQYAVLAPFASDIERSWGVNNYMKLSNYLTEIGLKVVILGSKNEYEIIENYTNKNSGILNFAGMTKMQDIFTYIENSVLYVGNDSGLTHIALKSKVPKIAIIGGGAFGFFFPVKHKTNIEYAYNDLDCFSCEWKCIYSYRKCLVDINYEIVMEKVNMVIKEKFKTKQYE